MTKTLYISDLDGTLLNERSELSPYTMATLNRLIANGLLFTVATARTAFSTQFVTRGLNLTLPTIQMNGAYLYDFIKRKYFDIQYLPESAFAEIITVARRYDILPLVHTIEDNIQTTHFERVTSSQMREFINVRTQKYGQIIPRIGRIEALLERGAVYFCFVDSRERLLPLAEALSGVSGIDSSYYRDVSKPGDLWLLEFYSDSANKQNGVRRMRRYGDFDKIICFGDSVNDMPLFAACDECYAVNNASDELKAAATAVIGPNANDSVARWIEETWA